MYIINNMGNKHSKYTKSSKDYLLDVKTITVDVNNNSGDYVQFLVGDRPYGYFKPETEDIPDNVDKEEYYDTLANAYLFGII